MAKADSSKWFGQRMTEIRKQMGISQFEMAVQIGIGQSHLASIEAGNKDVALSTLFKIADGLGIRVAELIDDPEPSMPVYDDPSMNKIAACVAAMPPSVRKDAASLVRVLLNSHSR